MEGHIAVDALILHQCLCTANAYMIVVGREIRGQCLKLVVYPLVG